MFTVPKRITSSHHLLVASSTVQYLYNTFFQMNNKGVDKQAKEIKKIIIITTIITVIIIIIIIIIIVNS